MKGNRSPQTLRIGALMAALMMIFGLSASAEGPYNDYTYDAYDEAVPTEAGYLPEVLITGEGLGIGAFKNPADLYYDNASSVYVLDAGNNRIVVLSSRDFTVKRIVKPTDAQGNDLKFTDAKGLFVRSNGDIYVADMGAKFVYIFNSRGQLTDSVGRPDSDLLTAHFDYKPCKVLVDSTGVMYVISSGCYSGALQFDSSHDFMGFYGSESVTLTAKLLVSQLWAKIVPKNMSKSQARAVPVNYNNFDISANDIVYTTKNDVDSNAGQVRKLNYYGNNLLYYITSGHTRTYGDIETYYDSKNGLMQSIISDVDVDENGFITILDTRRNRVFQYDKDSHLLFIFGGTSSQLGCFAEVGAIESFDNQVLVLDTKSQSLTLLKTTAFGDLVRKGSLLLSDGKYAEGKEIWETVLKYDSKYALANVGLGKAFEAAGEYKTSLSYFYAANDTTDYSNSLYEYRSAVLKDIFPYILAGIALVFAASIVFGLPRRRKAAVSDYDLRVSVIRYPLYVMRHPMKGYLSLKEEKHGSHAIAFVIVLLFFAVNIFVKQNTSFLFSSTRPENFNIFYTFLSTVGIFVVLVLSNWALSTLMDGEGRFMEIWTFCAYALLPYVVLMVPLTIISRMLVLDESAFFFAALFIVYAWVFVGIMMAIREVHQFTMKQTVLALLGTAFGMLIVAVLYAMAYSMFTQLVSFVVTVFNELLLRI